ncbi:PEGA domain-containing protein [Niabella pedocola]|uniref:PEGA domain-containing protein n=1 Tax=Niabella pedocola TaxID=1752077 RepID=A0ABS8PM58_9BACT|nr:PEGA domain-containing protein [Niabella pedocola]MCD2421834.1 PEGA domain-containing protein [Niabella pedocola]
MKSIYYTLAIVISFLSACKKDSAPSLPGPVPVTVSTPGGEAGYLYIDGTYTGMMAPGTIRLPAGNHTIGVALKQSESYLKKAVTVTAGTAVSLTLTDKPAPKTWKALWIGLYETRGNSGTGDCSTHFSAADLDAGYQFFTWSLKEHFEKYAYGTMKWEVERRDIASPVILTKGGIGYTVEPASIAALLPQIQPGTYDCVFVFWREKEGPCSFQSNYFGLAWTNPMAEPMRTGYVTIKFDPGTDINAAIGQYKTNDPGVWIHEWLHTVGENYYQALGFSLPEKSGGHTVHAAERYGYSFPWMNWYRDFISGRVSNASGQPAYLGMGPEAFLNCTVREKAVNGCP